MRTLLFLFTASAIAFGQTTTPQPVNFPANPLPVAVCGFGAFNQLGSPRFTGGVCAIYPVVGSIGLYGTTVADIMPKKAVDPKTGRSFYAISASTRQGFHKDFLDTGRWSFLAGGDVGPSFSQGDPSGISVSLSGSFVVTIMFQVNSVFSFMVPIRMLYISGIGFNPVIEAGVVVNLKNLPGKK